MTDSRVVIDQQHSFRHRDSHSSRSTRTTWRVIKELELGCKGSVVVLPGSFIKKSYERGHRSGPRFPPGVPTRSPNFAVASRARPPRRIQFDMSCSHLLCRAEGT